MSYIDTVNKALYYYDNNTQNNEQIFKDVEHKYTHNIYSYFESDRHIVQLFDKHKKLLNEYEYEYIGFYYSEYKLWAWAWSIPYLDKKSTIISRRILNYGLNLDKDDFQLKLELTTSRFIVTDPIQLDIHVALASYLSKQPIIYPYYSYNDETSNGYVIRYMALIPKEK
jgi:hypothetical protein